VINNFHSRRNLKKAIILAGFMLILLSCDKDNNTQYQSILGKWIISESLYLYNYQNGSQVGSYHPENAGFIDFWSFDSVSFRIGAFYYDTQSYTRRGDYLYIDVTADRIKDTLELLRIEDSLFIEGYVHKDEEYINYIYINFKCCKEN
jgi:hypothetical protein